MSDSVTETQRGIALVLVLWVLALLTVIALAVVSTSRTEVNMVRNRVDAARMRALAEAGVNMALLHLSSREEADKWYPDGNPIVWNFAGRDLAIRIFNESSRIDINKGQKKVLKQLIEGLQLDQVDAEAIAAAVRDWRDPDSSARDLGAEDSDYRSADLPYGAKDANFDTVLELGQVLGVTRDLLRLLEPHVTVDSPTSRVMLEYASPLVQAALGEEDPKRNSQQGLREAERNDQDEESDRGKEKRNRRSLGGPVYRISVSSSDGGPSVETLVRLGGGRTGVASVLWRRYAWPSE